MKGPGDTLLEVRRKDQLERVAKHFKWKQEGKKEQEIFSKKLDFFFVSTFNKGPLSVLH